MPQFEPQNPDYRSRVEESFAGQSFMRTLGAKLVRVEPGMVEIALPYSHALTQQHDFVHAGALAAVTDSACGFAALSLMPADAAVLTVEFKINLLAPAKADRFIAHGTVDKAGRTLMVCTGQVAGNDGRAVASMSATMMVLRDRGMSG